MLPGSQRLSVEQFNEVMKRGRVANSSLFLLRILKDNTFNKAKVSAVAPSKVAKTAVLRNKTRRRIYSAVRPLQKMLPDDVNVIVFAKNEAIKAEFKDISADIKNLFVKAGLLK